MDTNWVIAREIGEPGYAWRTEKSWALRDPDLDNLWSGWKVGLALEARHLLGVAGFKQEDFVLKIRLSVTV